tara:strand:- start:1630 stop:1770 length:141 start_codon:yes stop_codon:yes gene_type:complete
MLTSDTLTSLKMTAGAAVVVGGDVVGITPGGGVVVKGCGVVDIFKL